MRRELEAQAKPLVKGPQAVALDRIILKSAGPALRDKLVGILVIEVFNEQGN